MIIIWIEAWSKTIKIIIFVANYSDVLCLRFCLMFFGGPGRIKVVHFSPLLDRAKRPGIALPASVESGAGAVQNNELSRLDSSTVNCAFDQTSKSLKRK
jgi:hypothetical protein